ncbi:MAG: Rv3235 family protein [Actinomycetaceae bacterium]|nr:Rv3235 family protein [Actinomycetaceae bacterium]
MNAQCVTAQLPVPQVIRFIHKPEKPKKTTSSPFLGDYEAQEYHQDPGNPERWAALLTRTFVEALQGNRPPNQLSRWVTSDIFRDLIEHRVVPQKATQALYPIRIKSSRCAEILPGVNEATVTFFDGYRFRAAALRIEAFRGRWLLTALELA